MECDVLAGINEISLLFTTDSEIQIINKTYRKKDKATDVLSFPQIDYKNIGFVAPTLGDIVISVETAKVQAKKYEHSLTKEIDRLLVHGILHLLGYDHENVPKNEAQRMRRKEKLILNKI